MAEQWLIDGCNFLHDGRSRGPATDLRELDRISSFAASRKASVIFVMDGEGPEGEFDPLRTDRFEVVRSGRISADTWIERRVSAAPEKLDLVVVSADGAVRRAVRGQGGRVFSPAEFRTMLDEESAVGEDTLLRQRIRSHGFHRPFGDRLKEKGP